MKENIARPGVTTHAPEFEDIDIFKYGMFEDAQRTLEKCTIGFSRLSKYNDPFENSYRYIHQFKTEQERNNFFLEEMKGPHSDSIRKIKNIIDSELSNKVVTCFSKTPYEPLMWAHYSGKHYGVCYCFNKDTIFNKYQYRFSGVRYSNLFPNLNYFDGTTTLAHLKPQIADIILTKSDNWSYEKEFRFYTDSGSLIHDFNPEALQGIIIGSRVTSDKEKEIIDLVNAFNKKHNTNVKAYPSTHLEIAIIAAPESYSLHH